jgi:hypothetical protein
LEEEGLRGGVKFSSGRKTIQANFWYNFPVISIAFYVIFVPKKTRDTIGILKRGNLEKKIFFFLFYFRPRGQTLKI